MRCYSLDAPWVLPQGQIGELVVSLAAENLQLQCWDLEDLRAYWLKLAFCPLFVEHIGQLSPVLWAALRHNYSMKKITAINNYSVPREWWQERCRAESCFVYTLEVLMFTVNPHWCLWVALFSYDSPHACFFPVICCIVLFSFDTEIIQEWY